ncbi:HD-GYP domain-containing protein [Thiovibrio frasassiensis]|uniref:HD-GYP domain-containing protein n=1 Tax=Thiovibrio frasassiensis TaxID=2984131 RepID=A0A9X4RLB9_9BACT|nr:HD-GYP domain-containing protein [Thiovibrio frasassiensis]MDG4474938.1 HD-GYP domain-containing protein [Thiovibrio frasassiensis]
MASIRDHLFDSSFLDQSIAYLAEAHKLAITVLDSDGATVASRRSEGSDTPTSRAYPFSFSSDIGSMVCGAPNPEQLEQAEPHIRYCLSALNSQLMRETELQETTEEMLQLASQMNFLFKVAKQIIGIDDLQKCYQIILEEIAKATKADQGFIQTKGRWDEEICVTHRMSEAEVAASRESSNLQRSAGVSTIICAREDGASLLYSPIKEKDGLSGQMLFIRALGHRAFSASEKQLVAIIENIISPTFETLRLYDSLQDLYLNTVKALAAAIDAKDQYTHGHSFRVAKYAMAIGGELGIDSQQLNDLEIAGYMHDLGKIGISELILGKPGKLTSEEFCLIQQHPVFTDKILQPIKLPPHILEGATQHHERMDGTGYPGGLVGMDISRFGRIIAVADVFDALTSKRPYRDALPVEEALQKLCEGIDTLFDREMILAFIAALQSDRSKEVLGEINMSLRHNDLQNLNHFLVELTEFAMTSKRD